MGRIIIKVKFQKTMKKKMMTILFLVSSSAIGACNNANKVDASKEAPRKRADSVEQDPVEVENERSTLYGFAVISPLLWLPVSSKEIQNLKTPRLLVSKT